MGNTALSNASNPQYPTLRALTLAEAEKQSNDKLVYPRISHDLPHHILERKLTPSSGRFSSSYRIRHQETGSVMVLKVFLVRDATLHQKEILQYQQELRQLNSYEFQQQGHLAPFQAWKMGGFYVQNTLFCPIYLVRPHLYSTMANRIVSRPFLAKEEKFFIAHQILKTMQFLHSKGICHGHLSSENIGLTSWNWVVLLDIMPQSHNANHTVANTNSSDTKSRLIRPVALAEDDPSDWVYFFQEHFSVGTPAASVTTTTVSTEGSSYHRNGSTSSGGEKKCYVAPERFVKKAIATNKEELDVLNNTTDSSEFNTEPKSLVLNPAMDIFSLGCVLMELFLNGEIAIDLGDLMEYKRSNGNLDTHSTLLQRLKKIESSSVRAACKHMLHLDPSRRLSAGEYLNRLLEDDTKIGDIEHTNVAPIPTCHESIFFPLFKKVKNEVLSADARIALAAIHYKQIIQETVGIINPENSNFFSDIVGPTMMRLFDKDEKITQESSNQEAETTNPLKHRNPNTADSLLAETERLLRQIEQNFSSQSGTQTEEKEAKVEKEESNYIFSPRAFSNTGKSVKPSAAALILFVQYVLVTIRHTQRPSSKIVGLQLLVSCATYCTDEVRLQRIIPSVVSLLHDSDACVRALSISTLSKVMGMVEKFPPSDAQIFPQYILKRISHLVTDSNLIVRLAFTESIADLAETALRFLDTCHVIKVYESADGDTESTQDSASKAVESAEKAFDDTAADLLTEAIDFDNKEERTIATSSHQTTVFESKRDRKKMFQKSNMKSESLIRSNYDQDLVVLQDIVAKWLITITTDTSDSSTVLKIAILENISQLCQFFGSEGVMVCILPQILAFLNNRKDWLLRATLCRHLPSVCVVVGRAATEQFVLPCVETALIDDEDLVVANALNCLASLVDIGLLSQIALFGITMRSSSGNDSFGMLQKYSILLLHPFKDIQIAACALFSACCRTIGFPDDTAFIHPLIQPFLKTTMERSSYSRTDDIISNLIPNLPQMVFDSSSNSDISTAIDSYANENCLNSENRSFILDKLSRYINARRKKKAYSNPIMKSTIRIFNHTIKEEQKEIATFFVPNQKFAEIFSSPLPVWYDELREKSITSSFSGSAMATLRTMSLLSKVYGLTIIQPEHSTQPHYMLKGDMLKLDLGFDSFHEDDKNSVNMEMQRLVSSDEAKVFISATQGEWGALSMVDQTSSDINQLVSTLDSVDAPTLPPSLGPLQDIDGRFYSSHVPVLPQAKSSSDSNRRIFEWKPKVDVLTCTSMPGEHSGPISRLGISQDQSFFVSGSHDGTCKVFETRQMQENAGELKSCCTYDGNFEKSLSFSRVNDLTVVENSHSIASAHSNGSVHVWRVDIVGKEATGTTVAQGVSTRSSRVSGLTDIRTLDSIEGEILSISHFNTNSASIVTYSSQMGKIHSWDLRCSREPFVSYFVYIC